LNTRQQRRALLREQTAMVQKRGIDLRDNGDVYLWSTIATTRLLLDILESGRPGRAGDAARRMHESFVLSAMANPQPPELACRKGCALCCYAYVSASAPEIFLLARHIRAQPAEQLDERRARIRVAQALNVDAAVAIPREHGPCPMLDGDACSVHAQRPGACRAYTSLSLGACEIIFEGGTAELPRAVMPLRNRTAHSYALGAALRAIGLSPDFFELRAGLRAALETPDAEERWLAGEDVFAGVPRDESPELKALDLLIAGATGKDLPPA